MAEPSYRIVLVEPRRQIEYRSHANEQWQETGKLLERVRERLFQGSRLAPFRSLAQDRVSFRSLSPSLLRLFYIFTHRYRYP